MKGDVYCDLLGYDTVLFGGFLPKFWRRRLISSLGCPEGGGKFLQNVGNLLPAHTDS